MFMCIKTLSHRARSNSQCPVYTEMSRPKAAEKYQSISHVCNHGRRITGFAVTSACCRTYHRHLFAVVALWTHCCWTVGMSLYCWTPEIYPHLSAARLLGYTHISLLLDSWAIRTSLCCWTTGLYAHLSAARHLGYTHISLLLDFLVC